MCFSILTVVVYQLLVWRQHIGKLSNKKTDKHQILEKLNNVFVRGNNLLFLNFATRQIILIMAVVSG